MGNVTLVGKKKNYVVKIHFAAKSYIDKSEYWWFFIEKDDIRYNYNSLWDDLKYETKEDCVSACEKKIDELCKKI